MIYHTSPEKITKIHELGLFGSFLFFSHSVYVMTAKEDYVVYEIDENKLKIIDACRMFHTEDWEENEELGEIIEDVMDRIDVDRDTAIDLIDETTCLLDIDKFDGEDDHWLQMKTAEAARALGYDGVIAEDEQGGVFIIDMLGKEDMLTESVEED